MLGFNKVFYCLKRRRLFELFGIPLDRRGAVGSITGTPLSVFSFVPRRQQTFPISGGSFGSFRKVDVTCFGARPRRRGS